MGIEAYVKHLSSEEVKLFMPVQQELAKFAEKPTQRNYRKLMNALIYGDEPIDFVPASCVLCVDDMLRFAQLILARMSV